MVLQIRTRLLAVLLVVLTMSVGNFVSPTVAAPATSKPGPGQPDFGPNVMIFDPSMPTSQIQATVDAIATQQVSNQFGTQRYALLFKPGTYGSSCRPAQLSGWLLHHRGGPRPLPE